MGLELVGFVDESKPRGPWDGAQILGGFDELRELAQTGRTLRYITATGDNRSRRELVCRLAQMGMANVRPWSLIHPRAIVGRNVHVGEGSCLAPGSIVTTNVRIGEHCILNVNSSVSHDCVVGDFVNINPGAVVAGDARIGEGCFIGAGATVIDKVSVGAWSVIGAGAVVISDIPPRVTAVGVPARVIKRHSP
jgi:sugar O-acyltransferase (sialic acid O-acetyltransferase NeuD family)